MKKKKGSVHSFANVSFLIFWRELQNIYILFLLELSVNAEKKEMVTHIKVRITYEKSGLILLNSKTNAQKLEPVCNTWRKKWLSIRFFFSSIHQKSRPRRLQVSRLWHNTGRGIPRSQTTIRVFEERRYGKQIVLLKKSLLPTFTLKKINGHF